jgi:hypothetical protein
MHDPIILISNKSKVVSPSDLTMSMRALQRQVDEHFFPLWGWRADLRLDDGANQKPSMKLIIYDRASDVSDGLGYHIKGGLPIARTYAKDDKDDSGEYTSTLSHELLEMIADPGVNLYARGPVKLKDQPRMQMAWVSYEVCDPVEGNLYDIDGVRVSNFVTPEFFEAEHKKGSVKFDFMGAVDRPFKVRYGWIHGSTRGQQMAHSVGTHRKTKKNPAPAAGQKARLEVEVNRYISQSFSGGQIWQSKLATKFHPAVSAR